MNDRDQADINSLIYTSASGIEPKRYQLIRFSTWRIYFFQEMESFREEELKSLSVLTLREIFPKLASTQEEDTFYSNLLEPFKFKENIFRQDNISHFICRMLYCHDSNNHLKFVEMEKTILAVKLQRNLHKIHTLANKKQKTQLFTHMNLLKKLLAYFTERRVEDFHVSSEEWTKFEHKITYKKKEYIDEFAKVPLELGEFGIKKRYCFVNKGNVFLNVEAMTSLVLSLYCTFLKNKLQKMRGPVNDLLANDPENQMNSFLKKTIDALNTASFDEAVLNNQLKLNLKNIEGLWKKMFPPCMLHINQKLRAHNHLKHEGRRQLWLFLKGCGMDAHDNQEYFRKHFTKATAGELKNHMYNIQHAYGLVGKKQPERAKNCRNIITGPNPKKEEYQGCPFAHWRNQQLGEYLRKNYNVSEIKLAEILKEKSENHFQVACGRLFEASMKSEGQNIPPEITNMLGKSPHQFFQAGVELMGSPNKSSHIKKSQKNDGLKIENNQMDIEF